MLLTSPRQFRERPQSPQTVSLARSPAAHVFTEHLQGPGTETAREDGRGEDRAAWGWPRGRPSTLLPADVALASAGAQQPGPGVALLPQDPPAHGGLSRVHPVTARRAARTLPVRAPSPEVPDEGHGWASHAEMWVSNWHVQTQRHTQTHAHTETHTDTCSHICLHTRMLPRMLPHRHTPTGTYTCAHTRSHTQAHRGSPRKIGGRIDCYQMVLETDMQKNEIGLHFQPKINSQ